MMSPLNILRLLLVASALASPLTAREPLRILPIGDSITQGGKTSVEEHTYRLPLQRLLRERGVTFDFVGTRSAGLQPEATWPDVAPGVPFDPDHEGYYGAKTAYVRDQLREHLPQLPPPDVALIHLGTNDQDAEDYASAIVQPLEDMIALLRARNPKVAVFIGHLNFNGGAAVRIRPRVEEMAQRLHRAESPVVTVHHYRGWNEHPETEAPDTFDWAHPNAQGQRKMAEAWLAALSPLLDRTAPRVGPGSPHPAEGDAR